MSTVRSLDFGMRGMLRPGLESGAFSLTRIEPSADLAPFVAWYWVVTWDRRRQPPYRSETVPFPSVNVTIEGSRLKIHGVARRRFTRTLRGRGRVFGIRFRPGMFQPFFGGSAHRLTDRTVSLLSVFGEPGHRVGAAIAEAVDASRGKVLFEAFLRERLPLDCSRAAATRDLVDRIASDRRLVRAAEAAEIWGSSLRDLERAFRMYVGVTPKWVIERYRLLEAAERLALGKSTTVAMLAAELGYFDQAHFSRAFKALIGSSPTRYAPRM
jgi:AraC-like DNA-binding protein